MSTHTEQAPTPPSTWEWRELPILEQVVDAADRGEEIKDARRVAELTELDYDDVMRGLEALHDANPAYLQGINASTMQDRFALLQIRPTERARRATRRWPSEGAYDNLVALLERRIAETDDPDERSQLQKILDGLGGMGRAAATSLLAAYVREMFGLG